MPPAEESLPSTLPTEAKVRAPEKELLTWVAPSRPFKRRNREFYITVISIAAIVGLITFLAEGMMPVILLIAFIFLFYVMNTVEPENISYQLTDWGLKIADKRTEWQLTRRFWFTQRLGTELLVVETGVFPGRIELVIKPEIKAEIRKIVAERIPEEIAVPSLLDKLSSWFASKLPQN